MRRRARSSWACCAREAEAGAAVLMSTHDSWCADQSDVGTTWTTGTSARRRIAGDLARFRSPGAATRKFRCRPIGHQGRAVRRIRMPVAPARAAVISHPPLRLLPPTPEALQEGRPGATGRTTSGDLGCPGARIAVSSSDPIPTARSALPPRTGRRHGSHRRRVRREAGPRIAKALPASMKRRRTIPSGSLERHGPSALTDIRRRRPEVPARATDLLLVVRRVLVRCRCARSTAALGARSATKRSRPGSQVGRERAHRLGRCSRDQHRPRTGQGPPGRAPGEPGSQVNGHPIPHRRALVWLVCRLPARRSRRERNPVHCPAGFEPATYGLKSPQLCR